jgi:hypothetical protein
MVCSNGGLCSNEKVVNQTVIVFSGKQGIGKTTGWKS